MHSDTNTRTCRGGKIHARTFGCVSRLPHMKTQANARSLTNTHHCTRLWPEIKKNSHMHSDTNTRICTGEKIHGRTFACVSRLPHLKTKANARSLTNTHHCTRFAPKIEKLLYALRHQHAQMHGRKDTWQTIRMCV